MTWQRWVKNILFLRAWLTIASRPFLHFFVAPVYNNWSSVAREAAGKRKARGWGEGVREWCHLATFLAAKKVCYRQWGRVRWGHIEFEAFVTMESTRHTAVLYSTQGAHSDSTVKKARGTLLYCNHRVHLDSSFNPLVTRRSILTG